MAIALPHALWAGPTALPLALTASATKLLATESFGSFVQVGASTTV